jgi:colanic acid/amylovoran biosynthesis protein
MRVLVLWADSQSANLGVRVIAEGMAELARRAWGPDIAIDFQDYGPGDSMVSFGTKSILKSFGRRGGPIKSKLRAYDVILDSGAGDGFTDIYGFKRLLFMSYANITAGRLGIPVLMGPQTVGPFKTKLGRFAARRVLRNVAVLQVRDTQSADCASKILGRTPETVSTDVVFLLPSFKTPKSRDVILNVSGLLWFTEHHLPSATYQAEVMKLIQELEARGRTVSLMAHVITEDAAAIRDLTTRLSSKNEVLVPLTLDEARSMVGSAAIVIGARMHACLNALSSGTPAIPWAYSRKLVPLMRDIGWEFGIDVREHSPSSATMRLIDELDPSDLERDVRTLLSSTEARLDGAILGLRRWKDAVEI